MTFLAPTALIFLFGIGLPILIHFLNRFNVKKVKFSSVRFLKSMEDNSIRNVKFKKLILLMLRIGIISALVLMLSRPVTRGFIPGWLSTEIDTRLLIVIDNSSSMNSYIEGKPLFDIATETAKELLNQPPVKTQVKRETRKLSTSDEVNLLPVDLSNRKTFLKISLKIFIFDQI